MSDRADASRPLLLLAPERARSQSERDCAPGPPAGQPALTYAAREALTCAEASSACAPKHLVTDACGDPRESARDGSTPSFTEPLERLCLVVADAARGERPWLDRIRGGLVAMLAFLEQERGWARPLVLEHEEATVELAARRVQGALAEVLNAGRGSVIVGAELTPSTALVAELLTSAVLSVIRARVLKGDESPLVALAPSLMSFIVEPYLGRGAANADLAKNPGGVRAPFEAEVVPIRAHPGIMLALRVIASAPGCSSREIEIAASAKDTRGKDISDVLKRLRQRGLIENARVGRVVRESNAWLLSPYGRRVPEVITDSFGAARLREEQDALPRRAARRVTARSGARHSADRKAA